MSTRREIRGLANSLAGFLVSRNNDLRGYWAVGCLCMAVCDQADKTVSIELLPPTNPRADSPWPELAEGYRSLLERFVASRGLPETWLASARVRFEFDVPSDLRPRYGTSFVGELFRASVEIVDDQGRCHAASEIGRCRPHDRTDESRRLPHMWRF